MRAFHLKSFVFIACLALVPAIRAQTDTRKVDALNQALKAGVISQDEYNAKLAQLESTGVGPAKKAALDNALKNGVLTQQEYDAKLQALNAGAPAVGGGGAGGNKTWAVIDTVLNMPAFKVTAPADWTFDGAILRSDCGEGLPFLTYRAYSSDKLSGVQWMPQADWYSASDPRAYRASGISMCNHHEPARARDVAPKIATDLCAGAEVEDLPPLTEKQSQNLAKATEQARAQLEQMNRLFPANFQSKWNRDVQRVKVHFNYEGHAVEEMLTVTLTMQDSPVSVYGTGPGGIIQPGVARLVHTVVNIGAIRAPAGKLDEVIAMLDRLPAVEMVPEWNDTMIALIKKNGQEALDLLRKNGQILREQADQFAAKMKKSNDDYHAWQQQRRVDNEERFAEDMRRKDASAKNFIDYVSDQTYYLNPSTGQTMTIKNIPGVDGYVGENPQGGWTQLIPVSH